MVTRPGCSQTKESMIQIIAGLTFPLLNFSVLLARVSEIAFSFYLLKL